MAPSTMAEIQQQESSEKEALYHEGATPLFLAIEETDWRGALDIAEDHPEQVRTWVRSTGTTNTTFTWSMWRRLPIHEACRRQAPAWLVSALFSTFPESAYETTTFGELPLHLAVESGAAPEVVNLIMVANWSAITTPDNTGRIPTDILDREELLLLDEYRIVHESLSRCYKAYTHTQKKAQDEKNELVRTHKREMAALERQNEENLKTEQQKQNSIKMEVFDLEAEMEELKKAAAAKDRIIEDCRNETMTWKEKAETLSTTIELLQEELAMEKKTMMELAEELDEKEDEISNRNKTIDVLSNDLRTIASMHEDDLIASVQAAERTMRAMVSSQIALQRKLTGQTSGIKALLSARGIARLNPDNVSVSQEEKEHHEEDHVDPNEAATALAAAAMAALKPNVGVH